MQRELIPISNRALQDWLAQFPDDADVQCATGKYIGDGDYLDAELADFVYNAELNEIYL